MSRPSSAAPDPNLARGVPLTEADRKRIADRYPASNRTTTLIVAALIVVVLGGWTLWAGLPKLNPGITGSLYGYRVVDDSTVEVTLKTRRKDPTVVGSCRLQAQATSGEVVGELSVAISGPNTETTTTSVVKTTLRATTAVLLGCTRG